MSGENPLPDICSLWDIRRVYCGCGELFVLLSCWKILMFVFDSFFFLSHSFVFLFACWRCREIKDGRKKTIIPLESSFLGREEGLDYFVVLEYFPKPVEIVAPLQTRRLKDIIESV